MGRPDSESIELVRDEGETMGFIPVPLALK